MTAHGVEDGQAGEMGWATDGEDGDNDELAGGGEEGGGGEEEEEEEEEAGDELSGG